MKFSKANIKQPCLIYSHSTNASREMQSH